MRRVARRPHDGATRNGVATLSSGGAGREETWRGVRCDAKGLRTVTERESSSASVSVASVSPRSTFQLPRVSLSTAPRNSETRLSERERERVHALFSRLSRSYSIRPTQFYHHLLFLLLPVSLSVIHIFSPTPLLLSSSALSETVSLYVSPCRSFIWLHPVFVAWVDPRWRLRYENPSLKNPAYYRRVAGKWRRLARIHACSRNASVPCVYVCACHRAGARQSIFLSRHCYCRFIVPTTLLVTNWTRRWDRFSHGCRLARRRSCQHSSPSRRYFEAGNNSNKKVRHR